jgi:hypothetical protein
MYQDPRATQMEGGNTRMLTRPGDDIRRVSWIVQMTKTEFAAFRTWVTTTMSRGTARFAVPVWEGNAYVTRVCQFASKPVPSTNHPLVNVQIEVFVFPRLTP